DYYFHIDTILHGDFAGEFLLLFKHCYELTYSTNLDANILKHSWSDIYTNLKILQAHGEPDGYPWAAGLNAFPGFSVIKNSEKAQAWSDKLEQKMYELLVETDFTLKLIFHSWTLKRVDSSADLLTYLTYPVE